jgi:putative membrane protein
MMLTRNYQNRKFIPFTIILTIAFFLSSWLVANVPIGESSRWVSALFIISLALPSFYYLQEWIGLQRGVVILIIMGIFPILIEAIGITTGFPYGKFYYTDQMGFKIFGLVPWSVAFAFAPLVLGCFTFITQYNRDPQLVIPLTAAFLVAVDLVLDPAAVVLNIWVWVEPGIYYGIPITNYTGWFLTALIATFILHLLTAKEFSRTRAFPKGVATSLLLSIAFWTGYGLWTTLFIPTIIGLVLLSGVFYSLVAGGSPEPFLQPPATPLLQSKIEGRIQND